MTTGFSVLAFVLATFMATIIFMANNTGTAFDDPQTRDRAFLILVVLAWILLTFPLWLAWTTLPEVR